MSRKASRVTWIAAGATLLLLVIILAPVASSNSDPVREIRLVARDMTYYIEGQNQANPTLAVFRGERVRVRLINRDPGMSHDFSVRTWNKGTSLIVNGEQTVIEFTAPDKPGEAAYACTPHGEMMRGTIRVE
jgi:FtsP/CotA-like multicopper oxidase with cupredoxin domain